MTIYQLGDIKPQFLGRNYFVADSAAVVGDITIGEDVSIWFGAVMRGDVAAISVGNGTNIQDNCVLHGDYDLPVVLGERITVGHSVILHGCTIDDACLIGMHATILSGAKIGRNCIIGAHSLVTQGKVIPDNSLVIGSPAKLIRQVTPAEIELIKSSYQHYVEQIAAYKRLRVLS